LGLIFMAVPKGAGSPVHDCVSKSRIESLR
jgi:hypothetical protein